MKEIVKDLQSYAKILEGYATARDFMNKPCDEHTFILLPGGLSSYRKTPGIEGPAGFDCLYICPDEGSRQAVEKHIMLIYGVSDADSLRDACERFFCADRQYRDFLSFWNGTPCFNERELNPKSLNTFRKCMGFAEQFHPFVGDRGFLAWDINERVNLARNAYACGIISEEQFWQKGGNWAGSAAEYYSSWTEYAMSCLCGAVYFMFCQNSGGTEDLKGFYEIQRRLLGYLFEGRNPVWREYSWFS